MPRLLFVSLATLFGLLAMGVDSCGDSHTTGVCTVDGVVYANGDRGVPAGDGCNTCTCTDGAVGGCTEIACPPGGGSCTVEGMVYADGRTGIPSADGCNTCSCDKGSLICTERGCPPAGGACLVNGVSYPNGSTDVPAPDGCNTCSCEDGLVTGCTEIACPPGGPACSVFGVLYSDGWAPAPDGCNSCGCENGMVNGVCTEAGCGPIPIEECGPSSFVSHPFDLGPATITGDTLDIEVSYSGGCAPHYFRLCYDPSFLESNPVQANVRLEHDSQRDPCEAYPTEQRSFDLTPLRNAYRDAYRTSSGSVILRLGPGVRYNF
ncbi:MAG: hypothetical protein AAGF12_09315 [Myxococcota bacterium]